MKDHEEEVKLHMHEEMLFDEMNQNRNKIRYHSHLRNQRTDLYGDSDFYDKRRRNHDLRSMRELEVPHDYSNYTLPELVQVPQVLSPSHKQMPPNWHRRIANQYRQNDPSYRQNLTQNPNSFANDYVNINPAVFQQPGVTGPVYNP